MLLSDSPSQPNISTGTYTIEVFDEYGDCRAFARADSISAGMKWLDNAPVCRGPQEKLMIRIEDKDHSGCWQPKLSRQQYPRKSSLNACDQTAGSKRGCAVFNIEK
jgi:hypothetical protein